MNRRKVKAFDPEKTFDQRGREKFRRERDFAGAGGGKPFADSGKRTFRRNVKRGKACAGDRFPLSRCGARIAREHPEYHSKGFSAERLLGRF